MSEQRRSPALTGSGRAPGSGAYRRCAAALAGRGAPPASSGPLASVEVVPLRPGLAHKPVEVSDGLPRCGRARGPGTSTLPAGSPAEPPSGSVGRCSWRAGGSWRDAKPPKLPGQ